MIYDEIDAHEHRHPDHEIEPYFVERWSPRSMTGEPLSEEDLMRLFEAARWAPSSRNAQPWRFLWARNGTPAWAGFLDLLAEGNRVWCEQAGALVVIVSKTAFDDGKPNRTHSYCAGAAWMSIALQGRAMGLVVHGMAGFDRVRAAAELCVPEGFEVEAMAAVGYPAGRDDLPERLRQRETPSGRKPLAELQLEGGFPAADCEPPEWEE
jgi:nitroreductase